MGGKITDGQQLYCISVITFYTVTVMSLQDLILILYHELDLTCNVDIVAYFLY
jgi:hypothetical protein